METCELEREVEALDREVREALYRLADKRDELEREREATALAADHHRQREEERRWEEDARAERERVEKAKTSYYELYDEDRMLCEERDGLASRLKEILEERRTLPSKMQSALLYTKGHVSGTVSGENCRFNPPFC
jgi:uncharacterized protein (DUF3084 family)